jgi:SAM-dependent methyltransferase
VLGAETSSLQERLAPLCEEATCLKGDALKELQDRELLPFEEESFDLICALDTLSEAHDDEAMISELRPALAPGGLRRVECSRAS